MREITITVQATQVDGGVLRLADMKRIAQHVKEQVEGTWPINLMDVELTVTNTRIDR